MKTGPQGIQLLKHYEGCKLTSYPDGIGVWTIGYGNTFYEDGKKVVKGQTISQERAEQLLLIILSDFENAVNSALKVPVLQYQFDALVCLCYNIGTGNFSKSTLVKRINSGQLVNAAEQFLVWDKSGGKKVKGLTYRRQSERWLFINNEVKFFN